MSATAIRQQLDPLPRNPLEQILEAELDRLQQRVLETAKGEFFFDVTARAREFLLLKGSEQGCGAPHLKLAIERHVVYPLANLLATDQILAADMVSIDRDHHQPGLTFTHKGKDLATPARLLEPNGFVSYVAARTGKSVELVGL
jgi:ATP-dependent Clp protease ATP-binding subunit ClpA